MKALNLILFLLIINFNTKVFSQNKTIHKIAFGSCSYQYKPQPILDKIVETKPDIFIYMGDNIYGDTDNMDSLKKEYSILAAKPEFINLKKNVKLYATWDDHDFGENDAGRHYSKKEESKEIFLNFFEEPKNSSRWKHKGIYHSEMLGDKKNSVQIILLDTRTFRDDLIERKKSDTLFKNDYIPYTTSDSTMLGAKQWKWLEKELKKKASIRIIVSSNQFAHSYNGYESWTNFPHEQTKMLELIKKTKANGVVFISGDVHWGELSVLNYPNLYPIYDITSSGITQKWPKVEPNTNRIGNPIRENNYGLITIDNSTKIQGLTFQLIDNQNKVVLEKKISANELQIK